MRSEIKSRDLSKNQEAGNKINRTKILTNEVKKSIQEQMMEETLLTENRSLLDNEIGKGSKNAVDLSIVKMKNIEDASNLVQINEDLSHNSYSRIEELD